MRTFKRGLGLLDRADGLMLAASDVEVTYYKYLKLRLLRKAHKNP